MLKRRLPQRIDERAHHDAVPPCTERSELRGGKHVGESERGSLETRQRRELLGGGTHGRLHSSAPAHDRGCQMCQASAQMDPRPDDKMCLRDLSTEMTCT